MEAYLKEDKLLVSELLNKAKGTHFKALRYASSQKTYRNYDVSLGGWSYLSLKK
jgi:hypothetical protein